MAHLILLLSQLAKDSQKFWVSVTLQIKELGSSIFYFVPEDGHIRLSAKTNNPDANKYIDLMNEIIDGKREVPNVKRVE